MTHQMPPVYSLHWDNISPAILQGQDAVFAKLGLELRQERHHHKAHGVWMNEVIARHQPDDVIVFCDIDAFPLTAQAYQEAVQSAERGAVFGLSQFSNHKKNTEVYAGPMFMAFTKATWQTLGSPSLKSSERFDAAEVLSARAREQKVALELKPPTSCIVSKWALGHEGVFGIGTFYGKNEFFHLFESRFPAYERLFSMVVGDVLAERPLNFRGYLENAQHAEAENAGAPRRQNHRLVPKFLRKYFSN